MQEILFREPLFNILTEIDTQIPNLDNANEILFSAKEVSDLKFSLQLREKGIINNPRKPFEVADQTEFQSLIKNGIIKIIKYNPVKHNSIRLFNSRLVREVKGNGIVNPYEKTRLVVGAWNDSEKGEILSQSPILQRASQRLIATISPSLMKLDGKNMGMWLRDISQAYTQSTSVLNRKFYAKIPEEFRNNYNQDSILVILRPFYGIPEAGTHWWVTYNNHHRTELLMEPSTYDPYLLISKDRDVFAIVAMQTDDTLILGEDKFSEREEAKLKFTAKPKEKLTIDNPLSFNGCILSLNGNGSIELRQKGQGSKIELVDSKSSDAKQSYVGQHARGAYLTSICQPEACFDLSLAAQRQVPEIEDITKLSKRLSWQKKNLKSED